MTKKNKSTPRDRMLEKSREYQIGTYVNRFVAKEFQRMIRAEAGAKPDGQEFAVVHGNIDCVRRSRGQCVCVTCGKAGPWSGGFGQGMQTGHFLASRRFSILFEEDNVAPQCSYCNGPRGGMPQEYRRWMEHVRGPEVIERLEKLKATSRRFTREELVDMRIEYRRRLKEAERLLLCGG
jgi:hypothetical protein